jgi:hypothetical protein
VGRKLYRCFSWLIFTIAPPGAISRLGIKLERLRYKIQSFNRNCVLRSGQIRVVMDWAERFLFSRG